MATEMDEYKRPCGNDAARATVCKLWALMDRCGCATSAEGRTCTTFYLKDKQNGVNTSLSKSFTTIRLTLNS